MIFFKQFIVSRLAFNLSLSSAKKKTSFEIAELKERLKASRETINCLKNEIRKLEEDDQTKEI